MTASERRAQRRTDTQLYRQRMREAGVPDRAVLTEVIAQELLREAHQSWEQAGKDVSIEEHRIVKAAMRRLLSMRRADGSPQYSERGIRYRISVVMSDVLRFPRPRLEEIPLRREKVLDDDLAC